jgi:flagellar biosynthesis protein FlhG
MPIRMSPSDVDEVDETPTQTYYDLLEVPPSATRSEIANAYQRAHAAFAPDSPATYMLFTPEETQVVSARLETAFRVLGDAHERARYDRGLGERTDNAGTPVPDCARRSPDETASMAEVAAAGGTADVEEADAPVTSADQRVDDLLTTVTQCDGPTIQRLREARDVSLAQINLTTKISLSNLRFIEADDLDALPAPVYLRGYLRQIAEQLDVDAEWVIAGYMTRISAQSTHIR